MQMRKKNNNRHIRRNNYNKEKKPYLAKLLLLGGFLCIIISMFNISNYIFAIENFEITGNESISSEEISNLIQGYIGLNLLEIKPSNIEKTVKDTFPIKKVEVSYKLPNTLILRVKEREALAALNYSKGFVLIDSEGYVVKIISKLESYSLPIVTGFDIKKAEIAKKPTFEKNSDCFQTLLETIKSIEVVNMELSEINLSLDINNEPNFYLYTLDGYQIFLGKFDSKKIAILPALLEDIREKGMGRGLLDISHDTPVFKPFN